MLEVEEDAKIEIESEQLMTPEEAALWKRRYQTSDDFYKENKNKERNERVIKYLHNDWSSIKGEKSKAFLNQFFIAIKTLIPMVIAHNPHVAVNPENDKVFEYDKMGELIIGPDGQPLSHDITKTAETIQGLSKKRLHKVVRFVWELRNFLRDALCFNRGIFLVGHSANTEYSGAFNQPTFHAFIKSIPPYKIKRQAGTRKISDGTYCFYEYELPLSHLKKNEAYNQNLLEKCKRTILEDIKLDSLDEADKKAGYYDDVQYIKLRNGYDLLTGKIFVFGDGVEQPLKVIEPEYTFKNPFTEFVPNSIFQPEQYEPVSDLMMIEGLVQKAQKVIDKAVKHVENFNAGYDAEIGAIPSKDEKKNIASATDRSIRIWNNGAVSGRRFAQRQDVPLGPEPLNMAEYLYGYVQKILAVYDFQQGGRGQDDETATKTQAKLQTSNFKGGDMSEMFSESANEALEKYIEVLIRTTDTKEVVQCVGDAGEVEYRAFVKNEAERGQYYCSIDLQSMGRVNEDVKVQQLLKLYEIIKTDPAPEVQQMFNRVEFIKKLGKSLGISNEGILRKAPDTKGMDEQQFRDYLRAQIIKAKQVSDQIMAGAKPLPPSPEDDDDIHLSEYLSRAQQLKQQAATSLDPSVQQQLQMKIEGFVSQSQLHIQRKEERENIEKRLNPGAFSQVPVANQPPKAGNISGQAGALN